MANDDEITTVTTVRRTVRRPKPRLRLLRRRKVAVRTSGGRVARIIRRRRLMGPTE
jgi:hypothetical protein